jgi:hypothetical protein
MKKKKKSKPKGYDESAVCRECGGKEIELTKSCGMVELHCLKCKKKVVM